LGIYSNLGAINVEKSYPQNGFLEIGIADLSERSLELQ